MDAILPYICGAHNGKKLITVCLSSSFPRWPPFFVQPPSIRAIDSSTDQKSEGGSESEPPQPLNLSWRRILSIVTVGRTIHSMFGRLTSLRFWTVTAVPFHIWTRLRLADNLSNSSHIYWFESNLAQVDSTCLNYTEAKVDVTQEIEQRAKQAAQAGADHCAFRGLLQKMLRFET